MVQISNEIKNTCVWFYDFELYPIYFYINLDFKSVVSILKFFLLFKIGLPSFLYYLITFADVF